MTHSAIDPIVTEINARLGRPLRVLHIGNIANNAYNNARIQRQYGIEADVLCYDYYHVMATPEWEDGGLTTQLNPSLPNWWKSNLRGFRRPNWYVQGPLTLCLEYLDAYCLGQKFRRWNAGIALEQGYIECLRIDAVARGEEWRDPRSLWRRYPALLPLAEAWRHRGSSSVASMIVLARSFSVSIVLCGLRTLSRIATVPYLRANLIDEFRRLVLWPVLAAAVSEPPRIRGASAILVAYRTARRLLRRGERGNLELEACVAQLVPTETKHPWRASLVRFGSIMLRGIAQVLMGAFVAPSHWLANKVWPREQVKSFSERRAEAPGIASVLLSAQNGGAAANEVLCKEFEAYIADHCLRFSSVLKHYDVIQGYSIDGIIPLTNRNLAFASYEHGTLRELPFEESLTGLICRVAYSNSPAIFVTNTDVLPSVDRLGLDPDRVHFLPHAFDEQKLMRWRDAHADLRPPRGEVTFFSPTRQHWRDGNRSLTKGNDVMLRAAGSLWAQGRRFRLVMVEWGEDVDASKRLIDDLGFGEAVRWMPPLGKQDLWHTYCSSHAVLDQFILPALGGVGFETLALGRRIVTHTDQTVLSRFFGAAPPTLPAATVDDVAASLLRVLDDPEDKDGLGEAGCEWVKTYHSARRIVSIQARVYRQLLGPLDPTGV